MKHWFIGGTSHGELIETRGERIWRSPVRVEFNPSEDPLACREMRFHQYKCHEWCPGEFGVSYFFYVWDKLAAHQSEQICRWLTDHYHSSYDQVRDMMARVDATTLEYLPYKVAGHPIHGILFRIVGDRACVGVRWIFQLRLKPIVELLWEPQHTAMFYDNGAIREFPMYRHADESSVAAYDQLCRDGLVFERVLQPRERMPVHLEEFSTQSPLDGCAAELQSRREILAAMDIPYTLMRGGTPTGEYVSCSGELLPIDKSAREFPVTLENVIHEGYRCMSVHARNSKDSPVKFHIYWKRVAGDNVADTIAADDLRKLTEMRSRGELFEEHDVVSSTQNNYTRAMIRGESIPKREQGPSEPWDEYVKRIKRKLDVCGKPSEVLAKLES